MPQYSEPNQAQFEARANSIIELMSEVTLDEIQCFEEVIRGQLLFIKQLRLHLKILLKV